MSIYVFAGPTISVPDARRILDAHYLPPASQGDVLRLVATADVDVIGIIDGNFREVPSVWHKELLWAISQGVRVVGAASMGALRAAELADFGMAGEGRIFEAYRSGRLEPYADAFEDDDEVAVIHAPAELGYRPFSDALVDMRCTFDLAARSGAISPLLRDRLVSAGKSLYYAERTYNSVIDTVAGEGGTAGELDRLRDWLPRNCVNQKRLDAVAMLARIRAGDFAEQRPVPFDFSHTTMWDRLTAEALSEPSANLEAALTIEDRAVFNEVRLQADEFFQLTEKAEHALRIGDCPPVRRTILAVLAMLRADGRYESLLSRAESKHAALAQMRVPRAGDLSGLQVLQLFDWYFDRRLGYDIPDNIESAARSLGYRDRDDFVDTLLQEYAFVSAAGPDVSGFKLREDRQPDRPEG